MYFGYRQAGTSLVSSELAKELELKILGSKEGQSAGGKVAVSLARVGSIAIVEIKLEYVDLGHIAKTIGAKIDGDLGYNFLRHFGITINYRDYEICLDDPQRIEDFGNASKAEVPIRLANPAKPLILVDVHANGRGPFQFAVDTGISTSAVTPELAKQLGVTGSPIGPVPTNGAHIEVAAGALQSFMVGGAEIENMAVVVADFFAMLSHPVGAQLDGIVGYNFLHNYKVVIDYPNELVRLF